MSKYYRLFIPVILFFTLLSSFVQVDAQESRRDSAAESVKVPNVVGKARTEAEDLLKSIGFQVTVERENANDPTQDNRVLRSSPSVDRMASRGSSVRLVVGRDNTVIVPNVVGKTQDAARSMLFSAELRSIWTGAEVFTEERDQKVVGCDPVPGTRVSKRTEVRVTTGWKRAHTVPNVIGKSQAEAEASLTAEKFRVTVQYENITPAERAKAHTVIRIDPPVGTTTKRDGVPVRIYMGRIPRVTVLDVAGKTESEARQTLESRGFKVSVITQPTDDRSRGDKAVRTSPAAGEYADVGSTVTLYVAKVRKVRVPDVVGKNESEARQTLESRGFKVSVITQPTDDRSRGDKAVRTSPAAGGYAEVSSTVTLYVAKVRRVRVPNVAGQTEAEAKRSLGGVGLQGDVVLREVTDRAQDKKVIGSSVNAGTEVQVGSTINLFIGKLKVIITPFNVEFSDHAFYTGPMLNQKKKLSELPGGALDIEVPIGSKEWVNVNIGITWKVKAGQFKNIYLSNDGGNNWELLQGATSPGMFGVSVYPPPGTRDYIFKAEGHGTDDTGKPVGAIKPVTDTTHMRVIIKQEIRKVGQVGLIGGIKIPDVIGMTEPVARKALESIGYKVNWNETSTTNQKDDDRVVNVTPPAGSELKNGETVTITLARYMPAVPNVIGLSEQDAIARLKQNTFGARITYTDTKDPKQAGVVTKTIPNVGVTLAKNATVELVMGKSQSPVVPFNASFKESTIRIQGKDYNFSVIPAGGLRSPSSGLGSFGISTSWEVKGGQVRAAYFTLNGGNSWTRFDQVGTHGASQSVRSQPGDNFRIKFKLEGVAGDGSGAPKTISSSQAQVQFFRLSTFDASFRELRLKVRDRTYKFEELPAEGLKLMSRQPVPLQVSADWEVKGGKLTTAMISRNNGINSTPMKSWSPTGGSEELFANVGADLTIKLTLTGMTTDDKGNPTGDPPKRIDGPRTAHITVQYLPKLVKQLKVRFTQQKVKVGDQTKSFSQIPASGWEVTPSAGSTAQTVGVDVFCNVSVEGGRVEGAEISKDGGTSWVPAQMLNVSSSSESIFKGHFDAQPGDTLNLAFQIKGRDVYEEDRQPVGGDVKSQRDSASARVVLRKAPTIVAPPTQVADVTGMTEPVARKALESVGYKVSWNETSTTNQKEDDRVVNVTPRAGSGLKKGETVTITLARYLPTVPSVIGLSEDDAIEQLRKNSFKAKVTYANTENLREESHVIKTVPFGGVTLAKNATVELIVGKRVFAGSPPLAVTEDVGKVLLEMGRQYAAKDFSGLMARVSDDFPNHGELEEWLRRDFRDFDGITLNLFVKRTTDLPDGADVEADWQMRCTLTDGGRQEEVRGEGLHFIFTNREGVWKLKQMRGPNPLFGGRSPDIAVASGAPAAVSQVLQKIEDEGSRAAKQGALGIIADQVVTGTENIPVTFELVSESANYADGAQEEVDFDAIQPIRPIRGEATLRISDNPKKIDFTGIKLQITDTADGGIVSITGDVAADETVTFRLNETLGFDSGESGTLIFTLDPDNKFITIDQDKKIKRVAYQVL